MIFHKFKSEDKHQECWPVKDQHGPNCDAYTLCVLTWPTG